MIPFQPSSGNIVGKKLPWTLWYEIFSDLNSNLQASSWDESIESLHADSRCLVVIKAQGYLKFENLNVMRKKNDKFNITIHYPYVWYENKVIVKVSK